MGVGELVVVTFRQLTELPLEPLPARIVLAAGTPAVAAPVAETFDERSQLGARHVDRTTFTQGEVVGRIERLRG